MIKAKLIYFLSKSKLSNFLSKLYKKLFLCYRWIFNKNSNENSSSLFSNQTHESNYNLVDA
jgi:hypothetical protein